MLEFIRRSSSSVMAWLILGVLALVFGLSFGLPSDSLTLGTAPIVKVHGDAVTEDEYRYQYNLMARVLPLPKDPGFQELMGLKEEVLDAIVERIVLAKAADDMGFAATKWDAETLTLNGHLIVLGDTFDWLGDYEFNYKLFSNSHLASLQVPEIKYLEHQRKEVLARTVRDVLSSSVAISDAEARAEYDRRANKLSLRYVRFEGPSFAQIVDLGDDEVESYVEAHADELRPLFEAQGSRFTKLPAQARLRFIEVKKPKPSSNEDGEEDKDSEAQDKKALADARRRIDAALRRIRGGEDFRAVARETSEDEATARRGGDFGWVTVEGAGSGLDTVVDEAAAKLGDGEVSEVLEGEQALYVVRVEGHREGDVPEADALRELASEALARERGKDLARQAADEALLALEDGKSMADLFETPDALGAQETGIEDLPLDEEVGPTPPKNTRPELRETGLFARDKPIPGIGALPELSKAAWEGDAKAEVIDQVFSIGDNYVLAGVDRKETGSDEGYADERAAIFRELAEMKAGQITSRWALRRCLEAKGKGEIVPSADQVTRLMTYDTKKNVDEKGVRQMRPYSVCDRVGNRGGLLRSGLLQRGGGGGGGQ